MNYQFPSGLPPFPYTMDQQLQDGTDMGMYRPQPPAMQPLPFSPQAQTGALNEFYSPSAVAAQAPVTMPTRPARKRSTPFEEGSDYEIIDAENEDASGEEDEEAAPPPPKPRSRSKIKVLANAAKARRTSATTSPRAASIKSSGSTTTTPMDVIATFKGGSTKAKTLKGELKADGVPQFVPKSAGRRPVEQDPENHEILRLRIKESYSWQLIADELNDAREESGHSRDWTSAAVYGRFVRNGPKIAAMTGEELNTKDYMHLKNEKKKRPKPVPPLIQMSETAQIMLIDSFVEAWDGFWPAVAENMRDKTGRAYTAKECAELWPKIEIMRPPRE